MVIAQDEAGVEKAVGQLFAFLEDRDLVGGR
jgi:hypothetical protein